MTTANDNSAIPSAFDPNRLSLLWAVQSHVADIARLHATMFPEAWDAAAISALLEHPASVALVGCQSGAPPEVGAFALAQVAADEAEILTLGVAEGWRRRGVGARLVAGIMRAAQRAGATHVFLEVAEGNAAARALYDRCGFVETAKRTGYYVRAGQPAENAIVLEAKLQA